MMKEAAHSTLWRWIRCCVQPVPVDEDGVEEPCDEGLPEPHSPGFSRTDATDSSRQQLEARSSLEEGQLNSSCSTRFTEPGLLVPLLSRGYLDKRTMASVRATNRSCRAVFDALCTHSAFGPSTALPLTSAGLTALAGMVARGSKISSLEITLSQMDAQGPSARGPANMEIVSARRTARSFLRALFPIGGNAFGPAAVAAEPQPPQEPWAAPRTHQLANLHPPNHHHQPPHHPANHQGGAGAAGGGSMRRGSAGAGPASTAAAAAASRGGGAAGGTAASEPGGMGSLSHASHRARSWMLGSAGAASSGRPAAPQLPQLPQSPTQQQLGPYPHPVPPAAQDSLWAAYQVLSSCAIGLVRLDVHGVGRRCRPQLAAALPYCTALRELALLGQEYDGPHWQYGVEEQHEATGAQLPLEALSGLTALRALHLAGSRVLPLDPAALEHLSCLTGLKALTLDLPKIGWCRSGSGAARRCEERSGRLVGGVLRGMGALEVLDLGAMRVSTQDMPALACHASLTCLSFGGVRLPDRLVAEYGTYGSLPPLPLPPALRRLHFADVQPLRELAALVPPPGLASVTGSGGTTSIAPASHGSFSDRTDSVTGPTVSERGCAGGEAAGGCGSGGAAVGEVQPVCFGGGEGERGGGWGRRGRGGGGGGGGGERRARGGSSVLGIGLMDWHGLQARVDFEQAVPQFEAAGRLLHGRLGAPFNPNTPPSTSTAASTSASTWAPASYSTDRHTAIGGLPSSGPVHPSGPFATTNSGARCASHGLGSSSPAKSPWGTSICIVGCVDAGAGVLGPLLLDVSWLRPLRHLRLEHITLEGFGIVLGLNPLSGLLAACPDIKTVCLARGYYALPILWGDE